MAQTILGLFNDRLEVEEAIERLKARGFNPKDLSIVMRDTREAEEVGSDTGASVAGSAASGAVTGAVVGGIAGLIAAAIIPGLGAFFIGGPIAAALGLGGAAATTVSGAATGAIAGGLIGALTSLGLSRSEAEHYEARVQEGAILLAVPVTEAQSSEVTHIFDEYNASDVKAVMQPEERMHDTTTQRQYADREERDESGSTHSHTYDPQFASGGVKGGEASQASQREHKGRGWHGDSEHHRQARKGKQPHDA